MIRFEDIQMISLSVKIMKFWSLILEYNWRHYTLIFAYFLNTIQWFDFFNPKGSIDIIIRNAYFTVLWFNTIIRVTYLTICRKKFENIMKIIHYVQIDIMNKGDDNMKNILNEATKNSRIFAKLNLFLGITVSFGFALYPLFTNTRLLPFGVNVPFVNDYDTPYYEILYTFCVCITPIGCCFYIPFTSLMVSFIIFGTFMAKILQYRLKNLFIINNNNDDDNENIQLEQQQQQQHQQYNIDMLLKYRIIWCVNYHLKLIRYVNELNNLITYICLIEFVTFGATLCALLFLLNIVKSVGQILIVSAYIIMTLAQIFALYWYANDLYEENSHIIDAVYNTCWFQSSKTIQKHLLMIIIRAQKPLVITVGGIYPMTLTVFQSLLNASYSYFTLLRRFYA